MCFIIEYGRRKTKEGLLTLRDTDKLSTGNCISIGTYTSLWAVDHAQWHCRRDVVPATSFCPYLKSTGSVHGRKHTIELRCHLLHVSRMGMVHERNAEVQGDAG